MHPDAEGNSVKVATFDVNGVNDRLPVLLRWTLREDAEGVRSPGPAQPIDNAMGPFL
jgi:hypothetical protein